MQYSQGLTPRAFTTCLALLAFPLTSPSLVCLRPRAVVRILICGPWTVHGTLRAYCILLADPPAFVFRTTRDTSFPCSIGQRALWIHSKVSEYRSEPATEEVDTVVASHKAVVSTPYRSGYILTSAMPIVRSHDGGYQAVATKTRMQWTSMRRTIPETCKGPRTPRRPCRDRRPRSSVPMHLQPCSAGWTASRRRRACAAQCVPLLICQSVT